jgi:hypothetical protein
MHTAKPCFQVQTHTPPAAAPQPLSCWWGRQCFTPASPPPSRHPCSRHRPSSSHHTTCRWAPGPKGSQKGLGSRSQPQAFYPLKGLFTPCSVPGREKKPRKIHIWLILMLRALKVYVCEVWEMKDQLLCLHWLYAKKIHFLKVIFIILHCDISIFLEQKSNIND